MSAAEKTQLAVVPRESGSGLAVGVSLNGMADVWKLAEQLARAKGFVPDAYVNQPAALAAVILTGVELHIGPMQAMREIHIIKGKPSISATLMLSLARRQGIKTRWLKTDATCATIGVTLPGQAEQTLSFTAEQAKAANLWGQGNWKTYPDAMLRARATSAAIRAFCPDVIGGSVYESESGELTDGRPAADVVEATVVETRREPTPAAPPAKLSLSDAKDGAELHAMLTQGAEKMAASSGAARERFVAAVTKHATRLGVDVAAALEVAGLAPKETVTLDGEVITHDPSAGEVAPQDEP